MAIPVVNPDSCTGCGVCEGTCPTEAIKLVDEKPTFDPDKCTACGACIDACPCQALTMGN